jgi:CcmD family protein
MNHFPFLFAAYTIFWVVIFFYVISIDRRGRRLERDLQALKRARSAEPPPGS